MSFKLEMSSEKLMESVLNLTLFGTEYLFGKLREPVNKTDWVTHGRPAIVNAFYSSIENSIRKLIQCYQDLLTFKCHYEGRF